MTEDVDKISCAREKEGCEWLVELGINTIGFHSPQPLGREKTLCLRWRGRRFGRQLEKGGKRLCLLDLQAAAMCSPKSSCDFVNAPYHINAAIV